MMTVCTTHLLPRCKGRHVVAILAGSDGSWHVGSNGIRFPQAGCPRRSGQYPRGKGWELCSSFCGQCGHAEQRVLAQAGVAAQGATLLLFGHDTICEACQQQLAEAQIAHLLIVVPAFRPEPERSNE